MPTPTKAKPTRLNIRATQHQKDVISRAARIKNTTVSDFVLKRAYQDAQDIVGEQTRFELPPSQWREFCKALDSPPRDIPELRKLLTEPSVFDE